VFVFSRTDSTWTLNGTFAPPNEDGNTYFGSSVAVSYDGTIVATGSSRYNSGQGAVWIYKFNPGPGDWLTISPVPGLVGDHNGFGISLSFMNNTQTLLVSAADTFDSAEFPNAVYTYELTDEDQSEEYEGDQLYTQVDVFISNGRYLTTTGDLLILGSTYYDDGESTTNDTCTVYKRTHERTWQVVQELQGSGGVAPSGQGYAIASNGEFILVGGPFDDENTGAIWFFQQINPP
jgi:hypothetical protein